ncbi:MAG: hypothetical protein GQ551_10795, partial [Myxococcales bacterium]|nr:hypothetical protein [Myxococcales bacterium]
LYHMPPSFYSQVARLVLEEKGVRWNGQQPWIAGETYSLADATWTVGLGRLVFFELEPTTGRPALKKYFDRLKARPSYASADIWGRAKGRAVARMFLTKIGERFRRRRRSAR